MECSLPYGPTLMTFANKRIFEIKTLKIPKRKKSGDMTKQMALNLDIPVLCIFCWPDVYILGLCTFCCPDDFLLNPLLERCYWISETTYNWTVARQDCRDRGAYLVEVNTQMESDYIRALIGITAGFA